jgi:tripartite-type tricarboxylate transporter receptor subunit TctC
VRLICAFPAGGPNDTLARLIGQWLSERLGRPFVVENRPGAATNIATEAVVRAPPDGYTLLLVAQVNAINVTLYERLNFNFIRDIAAVAGIMRVPSILEVNPSVPVHTVPEFIAYAKVNPGRLNMASAGNGTSSHLSGELFKIMTGVDILHVPYRGAAAALTDLIAARVQVYFDLMPNSIAHVRSGKVRPLAITTTTRSGALPDLPSVGDFVPGYEVNTWFGVGAPRGTPADIVDKLNEEINAALADPQMKARLAELGGTVLAGTPADFEKLIADETEKWARVIRAANIKPD